MKNMKRVVKENGKFIIIAAITLIAIFLQNVWSPYAADDYSFMYSWEDGTRITSLSQIVETVVLVYNSLIGRVASVFLCIFFLMFPKGVFNIVNTIVYFAAIYLIYKMTEHKKKFSGMVFLLIPALFWICMPAYGQLFLWLNGSINYLWSYFFALLFLKPYIDVFRKPELNRSKASEIGLCIYGLFFGSYVENVSFSTAFVAFLMICYVMYEKKDIKKYLPYVWPVVTAALGFMLFMFSPGEMQTHTGSIELGRIARMWILVFTAYYKYAKILLTAWGVLLIIAIHKRLDKKEILISVFLLAISIVSAAVLGLGSYLADRSLGVSIFFLAVSVINLVQLIRTSPQIECLAYCLCYYYFISYLLLFWNGAYDMVNTYNRWNERDAYIKVQVEAGATELGVPKVEPATSYSAMYGLEDVKAAGETWPNHMIAKYYGLESIYLEGTKE